MSTSVVTWHVNGKELVSFLNAKNNKLSKSNPFYAANSGGVKFQLECYSNGMNRGEEGSVDLFLKLLSLPEHTSDITLRYSLQCTQTSTSFTKIKTFNRETTNSCWPYNTLHLNELLALTNGAVTFECHLQILSIVYKPHKSVIGTVVNYYAASSTAKMYKFTSFAWNIYEHEYEHFVQCHTRHQLLSAMFGGGHFQLECYPNGTKPEQHGNVVMGLSLLSLPPLLGAVKLCYSLQCVQCNKEWSNVHRFSYASAVKGWPLGLIKRDKLYKMSKKLRHLTFKCQIEVLKLYDLDNHEITPRYWHRYLVDNRHADDVGLQAWMDDTRGYSSSPRKPTASTLSMENHDRTFCASPFETTPRSTDKMEIVKLTHNLTVLTQTMEMMKHEIYALKQQKQTQQQQQQTMQTSLSSTPQVQMTTTTAAVAEPPVALARALTHRQLPITKPPHVLAASHSYHASNQSDGNESRVPHKAWPPVQKYHHHAGTPNYNSPHQSHHQQYPLTALMTSPGAVPRPLSSSKHAARGRNHPRSISNVDQLPDHLQNYDYTAGTNNTNKPPSGFYPFMNSQSVDAEQLVHHQQQQHERDKLPSRKNREQSSRDKGKYTQRAHSNGQSPQNVHERSRAQHKHHKAQKSSNNMYDLLSPQPPHQQQHQPQQQHQLMAPLRDQEEYSKEFDEDDERYKLWYRDRVKETNEHRRQQRDQSDDAFATQLQSFVELDTVVKHDLVHQMKTNDEQDDSRLTMMSPTSNEHEEISKLSPNERDAYRMIDDVLNMGGGGGGGNRHQIDESDDGDEDSDASPSRIEHDDDSDVKDLDLEGADAKPTAVDIANHQQHQQQHHQHTKTKKRKHEQDHGVRPRIVDGGEGDAEELKKWLCDELGFSVKYFHLFMEQGYDNIDLVVELSETELVAIGIRSARQRQKLLDAFVKFNPFQTHNVMH